MSDNQTSGGITIHVGPAKLKMLQLTGAALSDTPTESMLDDRIAELERENAALEQKLHALRLICGTTDANKFQTRLDLILEKNIALQADKERLDWFEDTDRRHGYIYKSRIVENRWFEGAKTVRAAIDAARKEAQP